MPLLTEKVFEMKQEVAKRPGPIMGGKYSCVHDWSGVIKPCFVYLKRLNILSYHKYIEPTCCLPLPVFCEESKNSKTDNSIVKNENLPGSNRATKEMKLFHKLFIDNYKKIKHKKASKDAELINGNSQHLVKNVNICHRNFPGALVKYPVDMNAEMVKENLPVSESREKRTFCNTYRTGVKDETNDCSSEVQSASQCKTGSSLYFNDLSDDGYRKLRVPFIKQKCALKIQNKYNMMALKRRLWILHQKNWHSLKNDAKSGVEKGKRKPKKPEECNKYPQLKVKTDFASEKNKYKNLICNSSYKCCQCQESITTDEELFHHICRGKRKLGYICDICEKIFITREELKRDMNFHFQLQ